MDGADNNNSFFAQARGRYRARALSIQQRGDQGVSRLLEWLQRRVGTRGRSGVQRGHQLRRGPLARHRLLLRTRTDFDAQSAYVTSKPNEEQRQFDGTDGGLLRKNRVFLYLGYDQRQLTVPSLVQFGNGASSVVPQADDYDRKDKTWSSPRPSSSTPWLANTPHRWAATPDSPSST